MCEGGGGVMKRQGYNSSMCAIGVWPVTNFCCCCFCLTVDSPMFYIYM